MESGLPKAAERRKKMEKRIIWQNYDLDVSDWRECYIEFLEANNMEIPDAVEDEKVYEYAIETNAEYLDDERENLNVYAGGRIIAIADIGRWNGRGQGYKIINSGNVADILCSDCDYCEWYADAYNIRFRGSHHDGSNYILYRVIREDQNVENLTEAIYEGKEITNSMLNKYTRSLRPYVAKIYGW